MKKAKHTNLRKILCILFSVCLLFGCFNLQANAATARYTIKYSANGGSGTMKSKTGCYYGKTYTLTANAYKRSHYTFTGWNTKSNGKGKTYKNKAKVKNLTSKNGATVTLYAQWKKTPYTIKYYLNGGKNGSNPSTYTYFSNTITLKNPTRTGYTFAGWYSDSKYKTKVTQIKKGSSGTKTLYAKWTPITWATAYNAMLTKSSADYFYLYDLNQDGTDEIFTCYGSGEEAEGGFFDLYTYKSYAASKVISRQKTAASVYVLTPDSGSRIIIGNPGDEVYVDSESLIRMTYIVTGQNAITLDGTEYQSSQIEEACDDLIFYDESGKLKTISYTDYARTCINVSDYVGEESYDSYSVHIYTLTKSDGTSSTYQVLDVVKGNTHSYYDVTSDLDTPNSMYTSLLNFKDWTTLTTSSGHNTDEGGLIANTAENRSTYLK